MAWMHLNLRGLFDDTEKTAEKYTILFDLKFSKALTDFLLQS